MFRIIRKLVKNSVVLHNCTILQHCNITQNALTHETNKIMMLKDHTKLNNDIDKINYDMNNRHEFQVIMKIFKQLNINIDSQLTSMLKTIKINMMRLDISQIISILDILVKWKIQENTVIIQSLLQVIRASINELSINQIIQVHKILHKMKKNPLSGALKKATLYRFEQKIQQREFDFEKCNLANALEFAWKMNNNTLMKYIMDNLVKDLRMENMNIKDLKIIIPVLYANPKMENSSNLLKTIYKIIGQKVSRESINITSILSYIYHNLPCEAKNFPPFKKLIHVLLCNAKENDNTVENEYILHFLNKMHYKIPSFFLDYYVQKYIEDNKSDIFIFIKSLVISDFKLSNWKTAQEMLQNDLININCSPPLTILNTFYLLSLNCYSPELLEKSFTLYNEVQYCTKETNLHVLTLYWCVKLLYPEYNKVLPNENKLSKIKLKERKNFSSNLKEHLITACGSDKYIKDNLKTKWGLYVDYIVVKKPDGSLMDISNYDNITFVEELVSLSECNKIIFIDATDMYSTMKIQLKAIEQLPGYCVFVINSDTLMKLPSKAKIAQFQKAICNNISNI